MLRKIISIKNVGRFLNCSASGDVELKRYNLVFAENGRGKTTLCAVLRSLQSGEPAHVLGRTTLGTGDAPEIKVLLGGGAATFSNGAWSATVPELAIFDSTLGKTIEGIAADAERRVAGKIKAHAMHDRGETWLSEGFGYIRDNACPFCGQALDGVAAALIGAYKAYFSEAYNTLRTEIAAHRQEIENGFGDREIARVERSLDQNAAGVEFWSRYCEIATPALAGGEGAAGEALRTLRQVALALLDRKAATPLEHVAPDAAFTAAKAALAAMQGRAATYNESVRAANATIAAKKAATAAADVRTVESALTHLRATKKRHDPDARSACQVYESAQAEKKILEGQKEDVRKKLDDYTKQVIGRYEQTINRLLEDFAAGFRITGTRHGYPGGVASSSYQILINDMAVDLGDETTPLDRPSFRNTLSSGDKSTLALAFFLAQLDHGPDKAANIVVFDDPFNSRDSFRKSHTVSKIKKCGGACSQIIVLSHDDRFLKVIWDRLAHLPAERKCLRLARIGLRDTTISEWDIEVATQAQFVADRQALADYYNSAEGHPRDVVNKIRPVLETYCRNLYPTQLTVADNLGAIIAKIRAAGPAHPLAAILDDLETLNAYTTPYAHGQPNAATAPIDDNELHGMVKRTLTITGGC